MKDFLDPDSVFAAVKAFEQTKASLKERNKLLGITDKDGWNQSTEKATRIKHPN